MALTQVPNSMLSTGAPSWDASGNVGVGTSSPASNSITNYRASGYTEVRTASGSSSTSIGQDATAGYIGTNTNLPLVAIVNGTEQMRISTAGIVTGTAGNLMLVSGTAVASTSGTSIDFTGIPSWIKRISVIFNGVSTSGTSNYLVQIGSSSVTTTGYISSGTTLSAVSLATSTSTSGFLIKMDTASGNLTGVLSVFNISTNTWVASGTMAAPAVTYSLLTNGSLALGAVLDRVRITTVNGTDTFDAGTINIQYE